MNNTNVNMTNTATEEEVEIINPQAVPISGEFEVDELNMTSIKVPYNPQMANGPFYQYSPEVAEQVINNGAQVQLVPAVIENRQDVLDGAVDVNNVNADPTQSQAQICEPTQMDIDTVKTNLVEFIMNSKLVKWFETNKDKSIDAIMVNVDSYNAFIECLHETISGLLMHMENIGIQEFINVNSNLINVYNVMANVETDASTYYVALLTVFSMCGYISQMTTNEDYKKKAKAINGYINDILNPKKEERNESEIVEEKRDELEDLPEHVKETIRIIDEWLPKEENVEYETDPKIINKYYDEMIFDNKEYHIKHHLVPRKNLGYIPYCDYVRANRSFYIENPDKVGRATAMFKAMLNSKDPMSRMYA